MKPLWKGESHTLSPQPRGRTYPSMDSVSSSGGSGSRVSGHEDHGCARAVEPWSAYIGLE